MDFLQYKQLRISPTRVLKGAIVPPGSKSSSARAVLASTLAPGKSEIDYMASSNNVRAMVDCCRVLGATVESNADRGVSVTGPARLNDGVTLCPGNSGIVLRLLMGATAILQRVKLETPYLESLGSRANREMIEALAMLGVGCQARGADGCLPITLDGSGVHGGHADISSRRSSQFLSGLLYLGGLLPEPLTVQVTDELKAKPMVRTTLGVLEQAGIAVHASADLLSYRVDRQDGFQPAHYTVGRDPASTAALLAIAAAVESSVDLLQCRLEELGGVLQYLREVGVTIIEDGTTLRVRGGGELRALDFDGSRAPDAVLPLAALAAHADGTSRFYNIEHLRYKECDRISDFRRELERVGVDADERADELIVHGSPAGVAGGVAVDSHYDHGVILAMSLVGLRSRSGLVINEPQYVGQTYPGFFSDLQALGATVSV